MDGINLGLNSNVVIETRNLTIGYRTGKHEVLLFEKLELKLYDKNLVCLMGPNGAGKSTLIRTLAGLQKPLNGHISILSQKQVSKNNISYKVAVVLTDRIAAHNLTVLELITLGRYPYLDWTIRLGERDWHIINQSIEQVNIGSLKKKRVYELSDGQLQMVMIARALVQDTPIILLDEPTAHLDLNNRVEIMKLLKQLTRSADKTILIATHDLDLALQTADYIWLTGMNKNVITGIPEDLVLNDLFDSIFKFKGFDLKTGKVIHTPYRRTAIRLSGEEHFFLWTKNALERIGFRVNIGDNDGVKIVVRQNPLHWKINDAGKVKEVHSINELLNYMQTIS